ncbi:MAG: hypothetical protein P8012_02130 [Desulfobacterales bacterium]
MNSPTIKALVPAPGLIPAPSPIQRDPVCLDLYPRPLGYEDVFTVYVLDESDGEYGPDGRRLLKSNYAEFVDVYV